MNNIQIAYVKKEYFEDNALIKMLDEGDIEKQTKRKYLYIRIEYNENIFYIPLRTNLREDVKPYGRIGHLIPSKKRPYAGIDYRYSIVINDNKYIDITQQNTITRRQEKELKNSLDDIKREYTKYVRGFIRAYRKNRIEKEPLYRNTSLINYAELLINEREVIRKR